MCNVGNNYVCTYILYIHSYILPSYVYNNMWVISLSTDCQGKLWLPKKCTPKYHLKTILSQKTVHKHIGTTLQRLKIDSKSLDTSGVELSDFENF